MAQLQLSNLSKTYGDTQVLQGVDLSIGHGELIVLVGPSGCGKSTLLRMLCGLEDITEGELRIDGEVVNHLPPAKRGIAMVFQSYALYPHMTVRQNMAFGLKLHGASREECDQRIADAAKALHIDHLLQRLPRELSGGQRQRVAIGRAIVRNPRLFLFDEPLSNLDAALRVKTRIELARLHKELGATMVYVTHDQTEAMTLGDRIVVMHEGRVQQAGSPLELYQQPANRFVATFIGSPTMNLLPARVKAVRDDGVELELSDGRPVFAMVWGEGMKEGQEVEIGIRAEHFTVMPEACAVQGTLLHGTITLVEQLGESHLIYLRTAAGHELAVRGSGHTRLRMDGAIVVHASPEVLHVFDAKGRAYRRLQPEGPANA
jgi:multiple sugar transport system ATP-binding protein